MDCISTLKKLLIGIALSLFLSACTSPTFQTAHYAAVDQASSNTQQIAVSIKQNIYHDPYYQTGLKSYQAKEYTKYINGLIEQVRNKKISEEDARALLFKTYQQFETGTFNFKKDHLLNESPLIAPKELPLQIPEKPGAL
jgi:protein involved in sex pheromone biosynthesis